MNLISTVTFDIHPKYTSHLCKVWGSKIRGYKEYYLIECNATESVESYPT
jgi:hypothetical protein